MASCRKGGEGDNCDYQNAQCKSVTVDHNGTRVDCKVRRKGSTSWRDLHARPSFKIKKMETQNGSPYPFDTDWVTEKLTLNNGVQKSFAEAEVKAYDIFRKLHVKSSLAQLCTVSLYRDDTLYNTQEDYTMIETINDDAFMKKHFGQNWTLWEGEEGETECKRSSPDHLCDTDRTDVETLTLDDVDQTEMINYFVGERLTSHTDSACLGMPTGNNYYVAKWYPTTEQNNPRYTYIPSGVDRAFTCTHQYFTAIPQCTPIQQCVQSDDCYAQYTDTYRDAMDGIYNHISPCITTWHTLTAALVCGTATVTPLLLTML